MPTLLRRLLVLAILGGGLLCPAVAAMDDPAADEAGGCRVCSDWIGCACCPARAVTPTADLTSTCLARSDAVPPATSVVRSAPRAEVFHPPRP